MAEPKDNKEMDLIGILTKNPKMVLIVLAAVVLSGGNLAGVLDRGDPKAVQELTAIKETLEIIKIEQAITTKAVERIEVDIRDNREHINTLLSRPSGRPP